MRACLFVGLALVWLGPALALEVNLLEVDLAVAPGQVHTFTFIARNETDTPEQFTIYLGDWDRDVDGTNRFYPPGTLPRSLASWLSVAPTSFMLGPGETREVVGTLSVPGSGVMGGTYWGIIFVQGEPRPVQHQGTTVLVTKRIGIKVYASVPPGERAGEVRALEVRGLNPLWLCLRFANIGTLNLREVTVEAEVYDAKGNRVVGANLSPFPCLPGAERWVAVSTDFRPAPGVYHVLVKVDIGGDPLLAGQVPLRVRPLALVPLAGTGPVPQDLDGDGFYEDANGDGVFDGQDVALFQESWRSAGVQANGRAFDFNNDGVVDEADAAALAELLKARTP
ncbi:MAG: dockerin type I domain-containing protein [Candidatus Acetothermia bacterium]|jgi:PKD repeat protein|nr:dockerin type I domain-containing protein [Candidatus Acetothermia bacterium]